MDTITTIANIISSLGFPIVCTCILFYLYIKEKDKNSVLMTYIQKNTEVLEDLKQIIQEVMGENGQCFYLSF